MYRTTFKKFLVFQEMELFSHKLKKSLIFQEELSKPKKPKLIILLLKKLRINFSKNTFG